MTLRLLFSTASMLFAIILMIILGLSLGLNIKNVVQLSMSFDYPHGAMFLVTLVITIFLGNERWIVLESAQEPQAKKMNMRLILFFYSIMGSLVGQLLPMPIGMGLMREIMTRLHTFVPSGRTFMSTLHEYLFDLSILTFVALTGWSVVVGLISSDRVYLLLASAVMIGCLLVLSVFHVGNILINKTERGSARNLYWMRWVYLLVPKVGVAAACQLAGLSTLRLVFVLANIAVVADYMRIENPSWQLLVAYAIGQMAIIFPLTPGGVGVLEYAWSQCFVGMGYPGVIGAEFMLVLRVLGMASLLILLVISLVIASLSDTAKPYLLLRAPKRTNMPGE